MRIDSVITSPALGGSSRDATRKRQSLSELGEGAVSLSRTARATAKAIRLPLARTENKTVARDVGGSPSERRKEVALGRLKSVSLMLILGALGGAAARAATDDAAAGSRQSPPAAPIKYLEAGARLFNSARTSDQLALASKYLEAANTYRDMLQPDERATLDAYLKELGKAKAVVATSSQAGLAQATPIQTPSPATAPKPAPESVDSTAAALDKPTAPSPVAPATARGGEESASSGESKQRARWLLHEAREQIHLGDYDLAEKKAKEAESLDIKWGLFDDTPTKVMDEIKKARPKTTATAASAETVGQPHDRRTAKTKLKEARTLLADKQFEQAEALALDVKSWGLAYGLFEDSPDKVAAAARALRRRDKIRETSPKDRASQGVYDVLVQESRHLVKEGKLDEAEAKARQAQRMNVVPSLTTDRAETVLHEIAMARAVKSGPVEEPSKTMVANSKDEALEREGDVLLAKGDQEGAKAKFVEAERIPSDPAVMKSGAGEPGLAPELAPPADLDTADVKPTAAKPASAGEQLMAEARDLYKNGNYPAARQTAQKVKAGKFGMEAQADELLAQVALAEQGGALALYESALAALRSGDNGRAKALLTEVAASGDSLDDTMRAKVQDLLHKMSDDKGKPGEAALDGEALAAQRLNAEVGTRIAEGRRLQEIDPDKAISLYEKTTQAVHASGLPAEMTRPMVRRLEVALELAKKDKAEFEVKMQDKKLRAEIELKRLRILEADKAKKARMKELMDKATSAYAEGNFLECEAFAKRAMEIDPNELAASMLVWKAKTERHYKQDLENRANKEDAVAQMYQGVDKAAIADPEVQLRDIKFPKSFADLTRDRIAMNARLEPKKDPKVLAIESKLKDRVSMNVDKQPLSEAIAFLQNYTGLNIVLDPKAVSEEGLTSSSPVSLVVNQVQLKTALKLMLRPLGLTYKVEDEVVLITSPMASQDQTYPKTYYVGDLIMPPDNTPTDLMSKMIAEPGKPQSLATPGMTPGMMTQTDSRMTQTGMPLSATHESRPHVDMMPIIQLITSSIAPGTWRVNDTNGQDVSANYGMGGGFGGAGGDAGGIDTNRPPGAITPFMLSISLIVRHTSEVHEQVADLLRQLRRLQDLQVSVEVRFITVSDNFFEQIGVDFDWAINSRVVGPKSTIAAPNPFTSLFGTPGVTGGLVTGGASSGGSSGGASSGGSSGGGSSGGGSSGGGSSGGGSSGGGSSGGGSSGGASGGGSSGGGSSGGGSSGGGSSGGATTLAQPVYYVNPNRDYTTPSSGPLIVGTQGGGIGNFTPSLQIPFTNTTQTLAVPTNATPGAGATFGIAFLSDLEVYLFLTAAQGDTRSNVLQAPKVTTFNGALATIFSNQVQFYVQELMPIVGVSAVAFFPVVGSIPIGVTLSVTPVVSADRRYVRMTLSPFFNALNGFTTIQIPAAVGGTGFGGGAAAINGSIQLPNTTTNTVRTTVTVPDGGTVLLGGVKTLNEQRVEYGVPILSKTPLIDRLFRNIGIGRTTTSLMLMVTPRIVILEEEEAKLGIPPSVAL